MPPLVAARPCLRSQLAGFFLDRRKLLNLFSSQSPDLAPVAPQISTRRKPPFNNQNQRRCFYRISPAPKLYPLLGTSVDLEVPAKTTSDQRKAPTAAGNLLLPKPPHALAAGILFAGFSQNSLPFNSAGCNAKQALINLL
ncbi:hypothetical protein U1Q18_037200 [Sarracenia purpurea var. burkii]